MKLTKKTIELVCELEKIVGNQCYNPDSYDGYTMEYGRAFRYPVHYVDTDKKNCVTRGTIHDINKDGIPRIHYKFGANQLNIGLAIVSILGKLEEDLDLDFDELVKIKK